MLAFYKTLAALFLFPLICIAAPFDYDLNITTLPGTNGRTLICFHGYGSSHELVRLLQMANVTDSTLVGFDFPDHDVRNPEDLTNVTYGTLDEILPALFVLKQCVIDQNLNSIDLYGFSAGGGAVINTVATLNRSMHDEKLKDIGIGPQEKAQLLEAIQNGIILLDAPLKSLDEILDFRGHLLPLQLMAQRYKENDLSPILSLAYLKGLKLNVIVYFEEGDRVLSNRDDDLFIEKLKDANAKGTNIILQGSEGGHSSLHSSLWKAYNEMITRK